MLIEFSDAELEPDVDFASLIRVENVRPQEFDNTYRFRLEEHVLAK